MIMPGSGFRQSERGMTLIEIMVAMAVFAIVMAVVVKTFSTQQNTLTHIDQRSEMQITARNAMHIIESQIQMMGFSPDGSLDAGDAMDFSRGARAEGGQMVFFRNDPDPDEVDEIQEVSINLLKSADREDGGPDGLADRNAGATGLVIQNIRAADNIVAIRFAYAFDDDDDDGVDISGSGNIIWAIDTDSDGRLDTSLDTDDDGDVDEDDAEGGDALGTDVDIGRIKAVKVWLLVRSTAPQKGVRDRRVYAVGDRRCPVDDYYGHVLLETTVRCRNMLTG
jgi:prepilin-type N-terminal cleavage/methylation domain-containing protein